MDIGQRIRFVRLFRGMKQEELAEKIGLDALSQSTNFSIRKWKKNAEGRSIRKN